MLAIFKKEVIIYFQTPFGYVFIGMFLLLSGIVFSAYNLAGGKSDIYGMFGVLNFISIVVFPVLTMKLLAEEKKMGTDQLLFSAPITITSIILGKYFAALFVFAVALLSTGVFAVFIIVFGNTPIGAILGSYLGFLLLGSAYVAICLFASALTENQVLSAITGFGMLFCFMILGLLGDSIPYPLLKKIINSLAILNKYEGFTSGILKIGPLVYYISFAVIFIFFSIVIVVIRQYDKEAA